MSTLGDQLRAIALQVDALQTAPQPVPTPTPTPTPTPPPPTNYTDSQIRALGAAQGLERVLVIRARIPAEGEGYIRYETATYGGFGARDAVVLVFVAPAPNPSFLVTGVQTLIQWRREITLSQRPLDFNIPIGPDGIWGARLTGFSLHLSSTPSEFTRLLLDPGREYYVNINNRPVSDTSPPTLDMILTTKN